MKQPTCDCHKAFDFWGSNHIQHYRTASVGAYSIEKAYEIIYGGEPTTVYNGSSIKAIELPLNFCPQCGAEYREQPSEERG